MGRIRLNEDQMKFVADVISFPTKYVWIDRTLNSKTIENPEVKVSITMFFGDWESTTKRGIDYQIYAW